MRWYEVREEGRRALASFDAVLMRKDPPFDIEYLYATFLLEAAQREGARVFNDPRALRDHNEKFAITEFADYSAPTVIARSMDVLRGFHARPGRHRRQAARRHGRHQRVPPQGRRSEPQRDPRDDHRATATAR